MSRLSTSRIYELDALAMATILVVWPLSVPWILISRTWNWYVKAVALVFLASPNLISIAPAPLHLEVARLLGATVPGPLSLDVSLLFGVEVLLGVSVIRGVEHPPNRQEIVLLGATLLAIAVMAATLIAGQRIAYVLGLDVSARTDAAQLLSAISSGKFDGGRLVMESESCTGTQTVVSIQAVDASGTSSRANVNAVQLSQVMRALGNRGIVVEAGRCIPWIDSRALNHSYALLLALVAGGGSLVLKFAKVETRPLSPTSRTAG